VAVRVTRFFVISWNSRGGTMVKAARIEDEKTFARPDVRPHVRLCVSLNSRLESNEEEV